VSSCVYDDLPEEPEGPKGESYLNIALSVPLSDVANEGSRANGGYQDGDTYENYIDIDNFDYRIYFFDEQKKLIAQFVPVGFDVVNGTDYREYKIYGFTPEQLIGQSTFKVMVAANWHNYPTVTPGETSIDDICNADISQFEHLTNFELSPKERRLIPFYGIRRYENVKFEKGKRTDLGEAVTMLRAMAKVEVVLDVEQDVSFTDVSLQGYNERGYCAPQGVYSQTDYDHEKDWDKDYLRSLHLVNNGQNDAGAAERTLQFMRLNKKTADKKETWIAYIPEYRNLADDNGTVAKDEAYINLKLSFQGNDEKEKPFRIYFADYGTNGTTNSGAPKRMNIERNNIYRFTVSMIEDRLVIYVRTWNIRKQPIITL